MSKTLIALKGPSQAGKSKTFKRLAALIKRRAAVSEFRERPSSWNRIDFVATFRWHGTLVGLSSEGDAADKMEEHLPGLFNQQCAVIVTATRTRGGSVEYVDLLCHRHGYAKEVIEKRPTGSEASIEQYAAADEAMALELLDRIKAALQRKAPA